MILKFFYIFHAIFALNSENQLSKRDSGTFLDHQNKNVSYLEPKFNENCDEISLEAASECEVEFKTSEYLNLLLIINRFRRDSVTFYGLNLVIFTIFSSFA